LNRSSLFRLGRGNASGVPPLRCFLAAGCAALHSVETGRLANGDNLAAIHGRGVKVRQ